MSANAEYQNQFHADIQRFVNGALFSKRDLLLGSINLRIPLAHHVDDLVRRYAMFSKAKPRSDDFDLEISVSPYSGGLVEVQEISSELSAVSDHVALACVHGSLGSDELVEYSDFDSLIVLKSSSFTSTSTLLRVAKVLARCQRHMIHFDPLQHHGWMVLTEYDLSNYCDAYFPVDLFGDSKSILATLPTKVCIRRRNSRLEYLTAFLQLAAGLERVDQQAMRRSIYWIKVFLSQVMLIPALFIQAYNGGSISKKDSFKVIRQYFDDGELRPINQASLIRQGWAQDSAVRLPLLAGGNPARRKLAIHFLKTAPGDELLHEFDRFDSSGLTTLLAKMRLVLANISLSLNDEKLI